MKLRTRLVYAGVIPLFTVGTAVAVALPAAAAAGPALTVDLTAGRHPISPYIYGMNFADEELAAELKLPVRRWGGNATTRYNYLLDTTNRAADWYFENIPGDNPDPSTLPDGSETDAFTDQNVRTGTGTILTVPLIGWAPKAREKACGFSVAKYGAQQSTDQWAPDCGNGVRPDGSYVTGNDPHDTSVEIGPEYIAGWLDHLTGRYGTAATGGVRFYNLDNEPDIWHSTHRDVHPAGASMEEIRDRTYQIAAAAKAADPGAQTLGPVGWGWSSLTLSGLDQETCNRLGGSCWSSPPDRTAHGGADFGAWYLRQMAAYEQAHGVRILDYYDNHWYPQGSGVSGGDAGDAATQALRLRETRNLWDPNYTDESWINQPTYLIPRMKQMVAANYPGTKTAITEYNFGALGTVNGALAQADVLGIFGREGLDLASLWGPPKATDPGAYAFRMFRNYDGNGGSFGDTSVQATSGDSDRLAVYAATGANNAVTIVAINKTGEDLTSTLRVNNGLAAPSKTHVYTYSEANPAAIVEQPSPVIVAPPIGPGARTYFSSSLTFPANSITTFATTVPITDIFPPTAPGQPAISNLTSTGFTATWSPSVDPGGSVADYQITVSHGDVIAKQANLGNVTGYDVTGLQPGQEYRVSVIARDTAGNLSPVSPVTIVTTRSSPATGKCTATYQVSSQWGNGFSAMVIVRNTGTTTITGWTVTIVYPDGRRISYLWNGTWKQDGATATIRNAPWNGTLPPGGSTSFGFIGSGSGSVPPALTCTAS